MKHWSQDLASLQRQTRIVLLRRRLAHKYGKQRRSPFALYRMFAVAPTTIEEQCLLALVYREARFPHKFNRSYFQ